MSVTSTSMQSVAAMQVKKPTCQARWCIAQTQRVGTPPLPLHREWWRWRGVLRGGMLTMNSAQRLTDVCLAYFTSQTGEQKKYVSELCPPFQMSTLHRFTKAGMKVVPSDRTLMPYLSISYIWNSQHGGRANLWEGRDPSDTYLNAVTWHN
jgi:hypothetical protein